MHVDRRHFIAGTLGAVAAQGATIAQSATNEKPIMLATWPFGVKALTAANEVLDKGGNAVDAVEMSAMTAENDPDTTSVGYGGYPNENGVVQLDAAIIDGKSGQMGSVAAIENIRNPISVARKVMEANRHIYLVGDGAKSFALKHGFKEENLLTPSALKWYIEQKAKEKVEPGHDTIGTLAMDKKGDMAVSCTTSGVAMKWAGRVGDSPIIGAGLYLDQEVGGAVGTGVGERAIETCAAFAIVELMRQGRTPKEACEEIMKRVAKRNEGKPPFSLAFIALRKDGEYGNAAIGSFSYALSIAGKTTLEQGIQI